MLPDFRIWLNHFEYHAQHPRRVPEGLFDVLTPEEHDRISRSIATFQLGEQSDGTHLRMAARRFAHVNSIPDLDRIVELFVREEGRHAELLKEFMLDHGMPLKQRDWTDVLFRSIRKMAGFEVYLHVLIAAELVGNVYYRALESVTGCQRLRILCRTLVADELAHVGFESELVRAVWARKPTVLRGLLRTCHKAFYAATCSVVWLTHRTVLQTAGYRMTSFVRSCLLQYAFHLESPLPRRTIHSANAATNPRECGH